MASTKGFFLFLLLLILGLNAEEIKRDLIPFKPVPTNKDITYTWNRNSLRIVYRPSNPIRLKGDDNGYFYEIRDAGLLVSGNLPIQPLKHITIALPNDKRFRYSYAINNETSLPNVRASYPKGVKQSAVPKIKRVMMRDSGKWRGVSVASLDIFPIAYTKNGIRFAREIVIDINFPSIKEGNTLSKGIIKDTILEKGIINLNQYQSWGIRKQKGTSDDPFKSSSEWFRVSVRDTLDVLNPFTYYRGYGTGLYAITYDDLIRLGIDPASIDPRTIKIYDGGYMPLEENPDTTKGELREIPILVEDGGDKRFDKSDRIVFLGVANRGFTYDIYKNLVFYSNQYSYEHEYLLTFGGKQGLRVSSKNCSLKGDETDFGNYFNDKIHLEENNLPLIAVSPFKDFWLWEDLSKAAGGRKSIDFNLSNCQDTAKIRVFLLSGSNLTHHLIVKLNNTTLADSTWQDTSVDVQISASAKNLKDNNTIEVILPRDKDSGDIWKANGP